MSCFLGSGYSSAECVFKYRFSATINCAFFIHKMRSDVKLLNILIPHNICFFESMRGWQLVCEDSVSCVNAVHIHICMKMLSLFVMKFISEYIYICSRGKVEICSPRNRSIQAL
jgi:hypothetical protein